VIARKIHFVVDQFLDRRVVRRTPGHSAFFAQLQFAKRIRHASNKSSRLTMMSGAPRMILDRFQSPGIAPMIPGSTPSTPPSAHDGTKPGGGGSG